MTARMRSDGLFGPLVVHSPDESGYDSEHVLTISDEYLEAGGAEPLLGVYMAVRLFLLSVRDAFTDTHMTVPLDRNDTRARARPRLYQREGRGAACARFPREG